MKTKQLKTKQSKTLKKIKQILFFIFYKMYSVDLSHYNTPILLDIDGREHIFNKDNQIIRINEIGYFTKDELKKIWYT